MKRLDLKFKAIASAVLCALTTLSLGCDTEEQEQEIQAAIEQGVTHLEQGDVKQIFKMTTKDLVAYPGNIDRASLVSRLHFLLRNQGAISILHPAPEIDVDDSGESALVSMPFVLTSADASVADMKNLHENQEEWIVRAENRFEVRIVELSMVKQGDRWLVSTARIFDSK